MKTFEIEQFEIHTTTYRVVAANRAEAVKKLFAGEARMVDDSQELNGPDDMRGMEPDAAFAEELAALNIRLDDGVLASVCSVEEAPFPLPKNVEIHPQDRPYFGAVVAFAREHDIENKLLAPLEQLAARGVVIELGKDFAPQSFRFALYVTDKDRPNDRRLLYNGGLIFYAGAESGAGGPQYSVTTSGRSDARWEIHT
jgi:hypothetical protein